jgi:hypothetical protein
LNRRTTLLAAGAFAVSAMMAEGVAVSAARSRSGSANPFATAALRNYLAGRAGNVTAAAYDVNTGRTYLYRPGVAEQTASVVKVDILATLLHERQAGGGLSGAESAVAEGMIESSDNRDATTLWNAEGGAPAVQAFDAKAGMSQTIANPYWGFTMTTPADQLKLLRVIMLPNRLLNLASREYEFELMRGVIPSEHWGVSAGLAPGATVALKNGWLPVAGGWQVNSIGEVTGSGRHYLLAVMTNGDPTESYGIATIEHISGAVWRALWLQTLDRFIPPVVHRKKRKPHPAPYPSPHGP